MSCSYMYYNVLSNWVASRQLSKWGVGWPESSLQKGGKKVAKRRQKGGKPYSIPLLMVRLRLRFLALWTSSLFFTAIDCSSASESQSSSISVSRPAK